MLTQSLNSCMGGLALLHKEPDERQWLTTAKVEPGGHHNFVSLVAQFVQEDLRIGLDV